MLRATANALRNGVWATEKPGPQASLSLRAIARGNTLCPAQCVGPIGRPASIFDTKTALEIRSRGRARNTPLY